MSRTIYSVSKPYNVTQSINQLNEKVLIELKEFEKKRKHNIKLNKVYDELLITHKHSQREWYFLEDEENTKIGISDNFHRRKAEHISNKKRDEIHSLVSWTPCDEKEFHDWIPQKYNPFKFESMMKLVFEKLNCDTPGFKTKVNKSNEWYSGNIIVKEEIKDIFYSLCSEPSCFREYLYDEETLQDMKVMHYSSSIDDLIDILGHYNITLDQFMNTKEIRGKEVYITTWSDGTKTTRQAWRIGTFQYEIDLKKNRKENNNKRLITINKLKSLFNESTLKVIRQYYRWISYE